MEKGQAVELALGGCFLALSIRFRWFCSCCVWWGDAIACLWFFEIDCDVMLYYEPCKVASLSSATVFDQRKTCL